MSAALWSEPIQQPFNDYIFWLGSHLNDISSAEDEETIKNLFHACHETALQFDNFFTPWINSKPTMPASLKDDLENFKHALDCLLCWEQIDGPCTSREQLIRFSNSLSAHFHDAIRLLPLLFQPTLPKLPEPPYEPATFARRFGVSQGDIRKHLRQWASTDEKKKAIKPNGRWIIQKREDGERIDAYLRAVIKNG